MFHFLLSHSIITFGSTEVFLPIPMNPDPLLVFCNVVIFYLLNKKVKEKFFALKYKTLKTFKERKKDNYIINKDYFFLFAYRKKKNDSQTWVNI